MLQERRRYDLRTADSPLAPPYLSWLSLPRDCAAGTARPLNDATPQENGRLHHDARGHEVPVAELQAAGAAAQQLERQKNAASDFKRQFDCAPGALALVVGHNGQRLREIEGPQGARVRCAQDPGRRRIRTGARVLIEGATRDAVESAAALGGVLSRTRQVAPTDHNSSIRIGTGHRTERRKPHQVRHREEWGPVPRAAGRGSLLRRDRERGPDDVAGRAGDGPESFLESGLQSGTWDLEEACRAKAAATLAPHQARMLANLSSPLDPSRAALARQPVGREVVAEQMVDPYKFADAQWACARTPRGGSTTHAMTGQSRRGRRRRV